MKIISLLAVLCVCSFAAGCAHKMSYGPTSVSVRESTVASAVQSEAELPSALRSVQHGIESDQSLKNATEVPPYVVDKATDDAIALSAGAVHGATHVVTPTVRDVPAIALNKATDIAHDGSLSVARTAREWTTPTAKAAQRSVTKLGRTFVIGPVSALDRQMRKLTRYSIESYQGPLIFHEQYVGH